MELLVAYGECALVLAIPVAFAGFRCYVASILVCLFFAFIAMSARMSVALCFLIVAVPLLLVLREKQARPKWRIGMMSLWALLLLASGFWSGAREYRELHSKYPMESMSERLAYEIPFASTDTLEPVTIEARAGRSRSSLESFAVNAATRRQIALYELHSHTFSEFVAAFGFGANRMTDLRRYFLKIELPDSPESFPKRPLLVDSQSPIEGPLLAAKNTERPIPNPTETVEQFTASLASAYVAGRQKAAGFLPHAIMKIPKIHGNSSAKWQISRLELVSLLKFSEPRVYLSEHLPRMEELRNAETRSVDEFEQRALQQLRDGEDVVVDQQLNTIRMVGAVRAAKQCLDCHSVRRGELLGAFSYLLDRKQPIPLPKVESKPVSMIWR